VSEPAPLLDVRGLNQAYHESRTLWDVDLRVPQGACVSLIGRNGVGNTTLLGCLMGLVKTESGTIFFDGADITRTEPETRAALGIGYVPQGRMIFPLLTVEENLRTGLGIRGVRTKRLPDLVFDLFPVLRTMLKRRGGDLSGGQQQQLAIARARARAAPAAPRRADRRHPAEHRRGDRRRDSQAQPRARTDRARRRAEAAVRAQLLR